MAEEAPGAGRGTGLFDSIKQLLASVVAILQTRLELLSTEIEEERVKFSSLLLYGAVALFLTGLGIVLAILFFVVAFWETHRLFLLGFFAVLFLGAGAGVWAVVVNKSKTRSKLFSASLGELSKDREQLTSRSWTPD